MAILTTIVHKRKMSLKLKIRPFWISKILKIQKVTFSDKYPYIYISTLNVFKHRFFIINRHTSKLIKHTSLSADTTQVIWTGKMLGFEIILKYWHENYAENLYLGVIVGHVTLLAGAYRVINWIISSIFSPIVLLYIFVKSDLWLMVRKIRIWQY